MRRSKCTEKKAAVADDTVNIMENNTSRRFKAKVVDAADTNITGCAEGGTIMVIIVVGATSITE